MRLSTKRRILSGIRAEWGAEVHRDRDLAGISLYHQLRTATEGGSFVDDDTWQDLDCDPLFARIDRTISYTGSQFLYYLMHSYAGPTVLADRFAQYLHLASHADIREQILLGLHGLRLPGARFLPNIIFQPAPGRPRAFLLIYLSSFLTLLSSAAMFFEPVLVFATVGLIVANLLTSHFYGRRVAGHFADISSLSAMLKAGIRLAEIEDTELPQVRELRQLREFSLALNRRIGWLTIDETRLDDLSRTLVAYGNYFCLFNLVAFVRAIKFIGEQQDRIGRVYELVGSLDAAISVASYLEGLPGYCQPRLVAGNLIDIRDGYHPLLTDPVANSFQTSGTSALITGSNMAGKTTFIKTIGLNIILARTLGFCLAREASVPQSVVRSSIRRSDDINDNKSYYFKEIEAIQEMMVQGDAQTSCVFLIDEIFRGTNTIERIAAATSVLHYLSRKNITLVTTHDVELQELLAGDFTMHHFSERISDGHHYFDYQIHDGPTASRNAIGLLELKGYPTSVVREAYELAAKLSRTGDRPSRM